RRVDRPHLERHRRGAGRVGAARRSAVARRHAGRRAAEPAAHLDRLPDPQHQQPLQPRLSLLRELMANDPAAPDLDSRSYADLVAQTEALAQSYTSRTDTAWGPNPPGQPLDLGSVLVRLFARMAQQVVHRLNRVPEKSHLAFLELLGAQQQPPLAARAPLTFHPIDGSTEEPVVPQGTPVSAPPLGAQAEAVFETESELVLTRTQLQTVIVRQSSADAFTDATDIATRRIAGTYEAFVGEDPVEHLFYLQSSLFSLSGAATIQLVLGFKS